MKLYSSKLYGSILMIFGRNIQYSGTEIARFSFHVGFLVITLLSLKLTRRHTRDFYHNVPCINLLTCRCEWSYYEGRLTQHTHFVSWSPGPSSNTVESRMNVGHWNLNSASKPQLTNRQDL